MPFWAYCDCALCLEFVPRVRVGGEALPFASSAKVYRTRGDAHRRVYRSGRGELNWFLRTRKPKWKLKINFKKTEAVNPEHKSAFKVVLKKRPQNANRWRSRAGYAVCLFLQDGGLNRPLAGFRRYRALRWGPAVVIRGRLRATLDANKSNACFEKMGCFHIVEGKALL